MNKIKDIHVRTVVVFILTLMQAKTVKLFAVCR